MKKVLISLVVFAFAGFLLSSSINIFETTARNLQKTWNGKPQNKSVIAYN